MGKLSKYGEKSSSKKSIEKVEMIIRSKSAHAGMGHLTMAHRRSFLLNVPSEEIATRLSTTERKNQSNMTNSERNRFLNGIQTLISNGQYGPHVSHHADMTHNMHGSMGSIGVQRFLPWHRVYLFELEEMLQAFDPEIFIPYWDWSVDRSIPQWLQNFTPTVTVDGLPRVVTRTPGVHSNPRSKLPTPGDVTNVSNETSYTTFTRALEAGVPASRYQTAMHNGVHMWVGGIMSDIMFSPTDVLFWLHHANCDRLWAIWQVNHANQNPNLAGTDAIMDPWPFNEQDTRDTTNFGYVYT
jgi:tyrosinase